MVNVLLCAFESGINQIAKNLPGRKKGVHYFISWQVTNHDQLEIPIVLKERQDVIIGALLGTGLSKNRNNSVKLAKFHQAKGYFLIADDDVEFLPDFERKITDAFAYNSTSGILCFKVLSPETNNPFKNYWAESRAISIRDIDKISSIEIAGKMEVFDNLSFDERLGLGAPFPSGEEVAFLADAIRSGIQIKFVPEYIVGHPHETSGKNRKSQFSKEALKLIGGRAYRIYGERFALSFFLFSALKNYPKYRKQLSFLSYLRSLNEGLVSFKNTVHA